MPRNIFQVTVNLPASFRNNINNNEVFNPYVFVRNRLYHFVFHRFALLYARLLSDAHRKLIEFLILLASLFCFITLVYVHVVFVQTPMTCLDGYKDVWQRNGILRVEVLSGKSKENYTLQDSYWKEKTLRLQHFDGQSYYFYTEQAAKEESEADVDVWQNASLKGDALDDSVFDNEGYFESENFREADEETEKGTMKDIEEEGFHPVTDESILATEDVSILAAEPESAYIMEFSLEYGFLRLRPTKRRELNISVTFVVLDPDVDRCFGGSFNRFLLDTFLGYDNVLLASIKKMAEKKDQKGFVRNAVMDIEYIFINNWTNEKSYITAGFVMIIFTLTISTLLRHSHHQIFIVVGFWMNYVIASFGRPRMNTNFFDVVWPRNLIPSSGAPVLTVILALVGMEAVMSDFFHDRSIALYVIVIVWFADLYDAVCCQSALSKRHWFRFFYLYHFLFYAYNYKFGGVYWPLTLTTSWLFTLHSMVFFFHHYELPRFLHRAARMTAAHQAANNARPPSNPPDERPPENDTPEADPPDNDAEPTPETEESDQVSRDDNQPTSTDQADQPQTSSDHFNASDQLSSADEPGSVDHLCGANQFPTDQAVSLYQPNPISHPRFNGQMFSNQLRSMDMSLPVDQCRSGDKPKFPTQFESKDQPNSLGQPNFSWQGSTDQLVFQNGYGNQLSSLDQPDLGCQNRYWSQLTSRSQPSSMDQSGYKPSSTGRPTSDCLVPNAIARNCFCVRLPGHCRMCTQCLEKGAHASLDERELQISLDSLPNKAAPYLSQRVQSDVAGHLDMGVASSELESFYNFAHKILERYQGPPSQGDVAVVPSPKKSFELHTAEMLTLAVSLSKSPLLSSSLVCGEIPLPCLSAEQRFYVGAVEC